MKYEETKNQNLAQFRDVFREPRLIASSRIPVDKPFVNRLIDKRNRRIQQLTAGTRIAGSDRRTKLFDLRSKLAAVAAIDLVAFGCLSNAFLC